MPRNKLSQQMGVGFGFGFDWGGGRGVVYLENGNHKLVIIDVIPNRTNLCYIEIEGKINFPGWGVGGGWIM